VNTLIQILRAAHCRSTHHFFAIDGLFETVTSSGQNLASLLLVNYDAYLRGAKDPDTAFKDFENHVVHVRDGYWGGAAKAAEQWLKTAQRQLRMAAWKDSAYSLGVLSHYFMDPFMPLHTAQSERESIYHRPLEWSVCCAYQEIYQRLCEDDSQEIFELATGDGWLTDSIHRAALQSNDFYEPLIDAYDLREARSQPSLALQGNSKAILVRIFGWVVTAWGAAIDRIAELTSVDIPKFSLTLPTLLASIQVPTKKLVKSIQSQEQRREVEAILSEFQKTGKVVNALPLEQRSVKSQRLRNPQLRPSPIDLERLNEPKKNASAIEPTIPRGLPQASLPGPKVAPRSADQPSKWIDRPIDEAAEPSTLIDRPIVEAPAIGPKTAARFEAIGVRSIDEFLKSDPNDLEQRLGTTWITAKRIAGWQRQAELSSAIPKLTAVGAGLLVLAGIESRLELAKQSPENLCERLSKAAQSSEGQRIVRSGPSPSIDAVSQWIETAKAIQENSKTSSIAAFPVTDAA
jgi:hypothetical protein